MSMYCSFLPSVFLPSKEQLSLRVKSFSFLETLGISIRSFEETKHWNFRRTVGYLERFDLSQCRRCHIFIRHFYVMRMVVVILMMRKYLSCAP